MLPTPIVHAFLSDQHQLMQTESRTGALRDAGIIAAIVAAAGAGGKAGTSQ
jgi:hypothetical protein